MISLLLSTLLLGAPPPEWGKNELQNIFLRAEGASRLPTVQAKDNELANIAGSAYRVMRSGGENVESYARRTLKKRVPMHPNVKQGQWLIAVMKQLYEDTSKRAATFARFERDRRTRQFFERKSKEAQAASAALSQMIETQVEGVDGFVAPLPLTTGGSKPTDEGAQAMVQNGKVSIENLDRATFVNDAPPADIPRTAKGAIRELMASQKQYNISAKMLGRVDKRLQKGLGTIRVFIPAAAPATYLNEIARGGAEAGMKKLIIMVYNPETNKLGQLRMSLGTKPRKKHADFRCKDSLTMQRCVEYAVEVKNRKKGALFYRATF